MPFEERRAKSENKIVNDFTIEVATVNGSGSQTSNLILTKAIFRMGVPVGPKNIFPSNIAGLPTWYIMRVNEKGYLARKRTLDIVVCLNPSTYLQDIPRVRSGGVVVYESDYVLTGSAKRKDVVYYPVPFSQLAARHIADVKLKKPLTNMITVGVLAELLGIENSAVEGSIRHQLRNKERAVKINLDTIELGRKYVRENIKKQDPFYIERSNKTQGKILIEGNTAAALGCLFGGCTVAAWYPITPASSLTETLIPLFEKYRRDSSGKKKFCVVQAEDEIAALGIVIGASWAGARAMTATSGPGICLMSEFAGLGYYGEVPAVVFDIQRIGPSTGLPTRTAQGDIQFVSTLSHGDTKHIMLMPATVRECFDFSMLAFDLADRFQTPIFVMSDLDLGMNLWLTDGFPYPERPYDRGKVLTDEDIVRLGGFERYRDVDGDGICYRTLPGNPHPLAAYFTRGSGHNEQAAYTEDGSAYQRNLDRLVKKFETARKFVPPPVEDYMPGAKMGILAYGSSDQVMEESRELLKANGIKTNYLRLRAYPFQSEILQKFFSKCSKVFVVEQNRDGQVAQLLRLELEPKESAKIQSLLHYSGFPIPSEVVVETISKKGTLESVQESIPTMAAGGE
ncbi:MAG: 2-oxoacid:acceptor oxidoreductase subunit alpha [Elusimicrobia bacterium]|nr:2-oxoacid:acceptor oxidoreductase subunit alpha [Elusimicrobiota bacterium]